MSDAIKGLIELNARWPGFFEFIRAANDYETSLTKEQVAEVNAKIYSDIKGVEIFARSMMLLTSPGGATQQEKDWLRDNGFIHKKMVAHQQRLDDLNEIIEHEWLSNTEKKAIQDEVSDILADIKKLSGDGATMMQRGFGNLQQTLEA